MIKKTILFVLVAILTFSCGIVRNNGLITSSQIKSAPVVYQFNKKVPDNNTNQVYYGSYFYDFDDYVGNLENPEIWIGLRQSSIAGIYLLSRSPEETIFSVQVKELILHKRQGNFSTYTLKQLDAK